MANVECRKCGLLAHSKCIHSRNIFPMWENGTAEAIEFTCLGLSVESDDYFHTCKLGWKLSVDKMERGKVIRDDRDPMDRILDMLERFAALSRDERQMVLCQHDWKYRDGCGPTI